MNSNFEIKSVAIEDKVILENLLELYCYDFSELIDLDVNEVGKFGYKYLDNYWTETGRFPFLIEIGGKFGGFVLVHQLENKDFEMAEFFILRKFRRLGVGREVAWQIFGMFAGNWQVSQMLENPATQKFWRKVIGEFTKDDFQEEKGEKIIQRFKTINK